MPGGCLALVVPLGLWAQCHSPAGSETLPGCSLRGQDPRCPQLASGLGGAPGSLSLMGWTPGPPRALLGLHRKGLCLQATGAGCEVHFQVDSPKGGARGAVGVSKLGCCCQHDGWSSTTDVPLGTAGVWFWFSTRFGVSFWACLPH